jgi:hypothetical protein
VDLVAHQIGVGSGEVDELEDAELLLRTGWFQQLTRRDAVFGDRDHLARGDLAHEGRADHVEGR